MDGDRETARLKELIIQGPTSFAVENLKSSLEKCHDEEGRNIITSWLENIGEFREKYYQQGYNSIIWAAMIESIEIGNLQLVQLFTPEFKRIRLVGSHGFIIERALECKSRNTSSGSLDNDKIDKIIAWAVNMAPADDKTRGLFRSYPSKALEQGCIKTMKLLINSGFQRCVCIFLEAAAKTTDDVEMLEWVFENLNKTHPIDLCCYPRMSKLTEVAVAILSNNMKSAKWFINHPYTFVTSRSSITEAFKFVIEEEEEEEIPSLVERFDELVRDADANLILTGLKTGNKHGLKSLFSKPYYDELIYTFATTIEMDVSLLKEVHNIVFTLLYLKKYKLCKYLLDQQDIRRRVKWFYARENLDEWYNLFNLLVYEDTEENTFWCEWLIDNFFNKQYIFENCVDLIILKDNIQLFVKIWPYSSHSVLSYLTDMKSPRILKYCINISEEAAHILLDYYCQKAVLHPSEENLIQVEQIIDLIKEVGKLRNHVKLKYVGTMKPLKDILDKHECQIVLSPDVTSFEERKPITIPKRIPPAWL